MPCRFMGKEGEVRIVIAFGNPGSLRLPFGVFVRKRLRRVNSCHLNDIKMI